MPRRNTPFIAGHYYHLYNRGNNRECIFFEADNYRYFLRGIKKYLLPVMDVIAYCLMPTHYHLLVRIQPKTSEVSGVKTSEVFKVKTSEVLETSEVSMKVSRAMQKLSISYTKAINKRFQRVGSLFQGAFQAKHIEHNAHLYNLCVYIHANPVSDGLADTPGDWPYGNYPEWIGKREGNLVDRDFIETSFSSAEAYQSLVEEYLQTRKLSEDVRMYVQSLE
jgi:REP element-mobilizing transposase RayT